MGTMPARDPNRKRWALRNSVVRAWFMGSRHDSVEQVDPLVSMPVIKRSSGTTPNAQDEDQEQNVPIPAVTPKRSGPRLTELASDYGKAP